MTNFVISQPTGNFPLFHQLSNSSMNYFSTIEAIIRRVELLIINKMFYCSHQGWTQLRIADCTKCQMEKVPNKKKEHSFLKYT
ncbi:hypothetical protein Mgra_00003812 [Meloidogyne graminicola]|uniref:Uncharacterized protein n=1 Tax=Meloidogyne graminicola TaxID=189291 RepID=A0A8S9ZUD9_9BILA|nr:hypothetical protein Mgra_00003812 [Meloidogyne graminicola]